MPFLLPGQPFPVSDNTDDPPYVSRPQQPDVVMRGPGGETHKVSREYENIIIVLLSAGFRIVHPGPESEQS